MTEEFFTAREVARLLKVDRTTIFRWVAKGKLKAYRINRGTLRISREDLNEMIQGSIRPVPEKADAESG